MDAFLGIDYGTTGLKVFLFDPQGTPLAEATAELPVINSQGGWVEQDMALSWDVVCKAIRSTLNLAGDPGVAIRAIGVTGTFNQTVFNPAGDLLRPAILYGDVRLPSKSELETIFLELGPEKIAGYFGLEQFDESTLTIILRVLHVPKLLWLRAHEPDLFQQITSVITSSWDFIIYRLTGEPSYSAGALDLDFQMADLFSIPRTWFGNPYEVGDIVGAVNEYGSTATGLAAGTPVVMGTTDSACAFLGAGLVREGMVLNAGGTTDVVAAALDKKPDSKVGYPVKHLVPEMWLLSLSPVRGPVLRWFRDTFLPEGAAYSDLDRLAAAAPPGSAGLLCLPYFSGEKSVVHDPQARGMLAGLDLSHEQRHLSRAILEGVAYGVREILEAYSAEGFPLKTIYLSGGGARSSVWNQIKADVLGRPVQLLQVLETGCLGAAVLAAVARQYYPDRRHGSSAMVHVAQVIDPDRVNSQIYEEAFQIYLKLYPQTRPLLPGLQALRTDQL